MNQALAQLKAQGWTHRRIASALGVTHNAVDGWSQGKRRMLPKYEEALSAVLAAVEASEPLPQPPPNGRTAHKDLIERLDYRIQTGPGCWLWTGALTIDGYGSVYFSPEKKGLMAHRVVYELLRGPIPDGLQIDHLCRNTRCVNPDHLEPVTQRVNVRRGHKLPDDCGHDPALREVRSGRSRCPICLRATARRASQRRAS